MSHFAAASTCIAFDKIHKLLPKELKDKLEEVGLHRAHTWAYLASCELDLEALDPEVDGDPSDILHNAACALLDELLLQLRFHLILLDFQF